jgi:hypothetical protein
MNGATSNPDTMRAGPVPPSCFLPPIDYGGDSDESEKHAPERGGCVK